MSETIGISARELLKSAFDALKEGGREIKLPEPVRAEIADDSDWHRTRKGFVRYESAAVLELGGNKWAIAFGTVCGSYPADRFDCDIAAVKISNESKSDEALAEGISNALEKNSYYKYSLLFATVAGSLSSNSEGTFFSRIKQILGHEISKNIVQDLKTVPGLVAADLGPIVTSAIMYKPEFVNVLHKKLGEVLSE